METIIRVLSDPIFFAFSPVWVMRINNAQYRTAAFQAKRETSNETSLPHGDFCVCGGNARDGCKCVQSHRGSSAVPLHTTSATSAATSAGEPDYSRESEWVVLGVADTRSGIRSVFQASKSKPAALHRPVGMRPASVLDAPPEVATMIRCEGGRRGKSASHALSSCRSARCWREARARSRRTCCLRSRRL